MAEWLEADGRGGFAMGTADGIRTRRYHALLLAATRPPSGRMALVNGLDAWVEGPDGARTALTTQRYTPGVLHPDGSQRIVAFTAEPWPTWTYDLPDGGRATFEVCAPPGSGQTVLRWRRTQGDGPAALRVRLLLSGRDYHALHHENPAFRFDAETRADGATVWRPYPGVPAVAAHGGTYAHDPVWCRNFFYAEEAARGLDCVEDLASPGVIGFDLAAGDAVLSLRADEAPAAPGGELLRQEQARRAGLSSAARMAAPFLAARNGGMTVIAGYPWFTDWGRDTFIALRGLLIATGRAAEARAILLTWAAHVDQGMLPNRFPDCGEAPEYNSVDASLWFVTAVHDALAAEPAPAPEAARLTEACSAILEGYAAGTRHGIRMDADGLIACGEPGVQLTWMDAKVGDWVVTPRIGKPVEVQALWINALAAAARWPGNDRWQATERQARASFLARFPDPATGGLYDVVDVDHVAGAADARVRPNQVLAVGGLPLACVGPAQAGSILSLLEARLLTPAGLRTLDPADPAYCGRYGGGATERDGAYHQGTVWPWLLGPFTEAWLRVHQNDPGATTQARARFLAPLAGLTAQAGIGSLPEIYDGDPPHAARGCPFQAWSVGEYLRMQAMLGADA